ncbi:MAG TPA: hypothetical protein EYH34_04360 [Planctomycetes bacterium]|nr:hypothetical protein [Planctomycetota bacterium]
MKATKHKSDRLTRRRALARLLGASSGYALIAHRAWAAPPASGSRLMETQRTGAEIIQVTTERFDQSNIYCEVPYCSKDSRLFVYARRKPDPSPNRTQFVAVELGSWKQHVIDTAVSLSGCAIRPDGVFYYLKQGSDGQLTIRQVDLADGQTKEVYRFEPKWSIRSLGTVSADGRYYAGGTMTEPGWKIFDIALVDLAEGSQKILDRDPFILNPHPQFEPGRGRTLMIQHNRGGRYSADGQLQRLVGPEGATLYLLDVPGGSRTHLQVGKPHTTPCTGHEAWIGTTGRILLSVAAGGAFAPEKGNLLVVRAGEPAQVMARGYRFGHVGVSRCGRFFCCDDWKTPYRIVVGSTRTGRCAVVCESKTSPTGSQNTHPHPYLTPDLRWVIFNSNRTGFAHIYAARVPEGMLDELDSSA